MRTLIISVLCLVVVGCHSISTRSLSVPYTGQYEWDPQAQQLTFTSDGFLADSHLGWTVAKQVKRIIIAQNVRVTGRFNVLHSLTITGENAKTSVIYGTPIKRYNKLNNGCGLCKSAVLGKGKIVININNLTSLDPFGFHFTGRDGAVMIIDGVRAIDARGGHHNNSDGVSAASGSIVRNSYFATGDDIFKIYNDLTVENTQVKLITNTVPIQLGWGNYGNGAKGTFRNVTIFGDGGRTTTGNAIIDARKGQYDKQLTFNNVTINAPNSVLLNFWNEAPKKQHSPSSFIGTANIMFEQSNIQVKTLRKRWNMHAELRICGQSVEPNSPLNRWHCQG
ncbi:hypothetical protein C2869_03530 [Saccharobesus litoralis]|uniref:Uncharacterized protein n=1 Tax=Saccharobesus litoralis TaxID=2172099 RepID=A0A2S0VN08_9ALTE|nr:hypothetical protein [Saccharobesus litoralis]AWB65562.1 hypothetical protein C2869_03530 [Saccharobesus litoralis]